MNRWVIDIEANGLIDEATRIWFIVCRNVDNREEVRVFREPDLNPSEFLEFSRACTWVGHHILKYDSKLLAKFGMPGIITPENSIDTLVLCRMIFQGRPGGHSLDAYGTKYGHQKIAISDFSKPTEELLERCKGDTLINWLLFKDHEKYLPTFAKALEVEQIVDWLTDREIHDNGFQLDVARLRALHEEISKEVTRLTEEMRDVFLPRPKPIRVVNPKATKFGTLNSQDFRWVEDGDLSSFSVGAPFTRFMWVPFNPGSPLQVVQRLNEAKWKPYEKTDGHKDEEKVRPKTEQERAEHAKRMAHFRVYGWSTSEENLATLPADAPEAANHLVRWLMLASRQRKIEEWLAVLYDDGSIHGTVTGIGTWTHRGAHTNPNTGNIPSVAPKYNPHGPIFPEASKLGKALRSMWISRPGRCLVGTDADGIQLRVLAHYMNDPKFTEALINGNKDLGTDAHSLNAAALGPVCHSRDVAKTFIYAWLLGAGVAKVGQILSCSTADAREAIRRFVEAYPGLRQLKEETIVRDARNGYFVGLDGRKVIPRGDDVDSKAYSMLSGYLQNGEAVIMKHATVNWYKQAKAELIPFWWVGWIHDEWQTEVADELLQGEVKGKVIWMPRPGSYADRFGSLQRSAIVSVGAELGLNCPMAGQSKFGYNWLDTH